MYTNEQTQNEQFAKESLILKGIASNLLSMQFPKFKNLIEMLQYFDYDVKIEPKIFDSDNVVIDFARKYSHIKFEIAKYEHDLANKQNSYEKISNVYSGLLKKIVLCENMMSLYSTNEIELNYNKQLINFGKNDERYMRVIEFLSERNNILTPDLPIFKYSGKTYSVTEYPFNNETELIEFCINKKEIIFVYQIKIFNDNSIILRGNYEK